ncbi:MAG: exodeoxyribonuclease VII large subunit [Holosporales bacterium]|jgi:exodeoxyribonuclease VII large subunit|nr:exodeoxyribonuclease VII large subunit [Holosporales bacterium]
MSHKDLKSPTLPLWSTPEPPPPQDQEDLSPCIPNPPSDERVFSVSELSFALKKVVESQFSVVCVRGEVSSLRSHTSGHLYFALKDSQAVLDAVYWKGALRTRHLPLEEGMEIRCWAQLTTYPARSKYQLIVERYELAGQGAILKMLEERKQRLRHEGLFDQDHKKALPFLPRKIGIVTSPTGAVLRDILHRLADRFPVSVVVWPVLVQGEDAATQVAEAVYGFNALPLTTRPDVLIVARGGGSVEDLLPFSEEKVVRAVFQSAIPVISAIGHETDTTLIDFVADVRAPTPTAAAELAVPVRRTLLANLEALAHQLSQALIHHADRKASRLHACSMPPVWRIISLRSQDLDRSADRLTSHVHTLLDVKRLAAMRLSVRGRPSVDRLLMWGKHVATSDLTLRKAIRTLVETSHTALCHTSDLLEHVSFARLLKRGFALVQNVQGHFITSATEAKKHSYIDIVFHDDTCRVTPTKTKRTPSPCTQEHFGWKT